MFEQQIKAEPMNFYACAPPPPPSAHQRIQEPPPIPLVNNEHSVINIAADNNVIIDKDIQQPLSVPQPPDTPVSQVSQGSQIGVLSNIVVTKSETQRKPQACKVCGKILSSASSYYVHMKLHSGNKPFQCTVCDAAFCRKPYLEVHMRTHTGERPFQCDLCMKRFTQKSSLNTHKRVHTGERPFQCTSCLKSFSQKCALHLHEKIHTGYWSLHKPFQCTQCEAAFCRKPYLDIHMRTHTGERPFQCDVCLKRFTQKSSLNIHKRIHTGNVTQNIATEMASCYNMIHTDDESTSESENVANDSSLGQIISETSSCEEGEVSCYSIKYTKAQKTSEPENLVKNSRLGKNVSETNLCEEGNAYKVTRKKHKKKHRLKNEPEFEHEVQMLPVSCELLDPLALDVCKRPSITIKIVKKTGLQDNLCSDKESLDVASSSKHVSGKEVLSTKLEKNKVTASPMSDSSDVECSKFWKHFNY